VLGDWRFIGSQAVAHGCEAAFGGWLRADVRMTTTFFHLQDLLFWQAATCWCVARPGEINSKRALMHA
jgi:hypothetical protein